MGCKDITPPRRIVCKLNKKMALYKRELQSHGFNTLQPDIVYNVVFEKFWCAIETIGGSYTRDQIAVDTKATHIIYSRFFQYGDNQDAFEADSHRLIDPLTGDEFIIKQLMNLDQRSEYYKIYSALVGKNDRWGVNASRD